VYCRPAAAPLHAAHPWNMSMHEQADSPRYALLVCYAGQYWQGWQSQPGDVTVQDRLELALGDFFKMQRVAVHGSGRTDAGVHALGQVCHFDAPAELKQSPQVLVRALNARLPQSIRVLQAVACPASFHARYSAVGKTYVYRFCNAEVMSPHRLDLCWHCVFPLDLALLEQALQCYVGEHDFRCFAAKRGNEPQPLPQDFYLRSIYSAELQQLEPGYHELRFHGNGFLYKMVRMLSGAAFDVARGRLSLQQLRTYLQQPELAPQRRWSVPACGLYLQQVDYAADNPF